MVRATNFLVKIRQPPLINRAVTLRERYKVEYVAQIICVCKYSSEFTSVINSPNKGKSCPQFMGLKVILYFRGVEEVGLVFSTVTSESLMEGIAEGLINP